MIPSPRVLFTLLASGLIFSSSALADTYYDTSGVTNNSGVPIDITYWQGLRNYGNSTNLFFTGTASNNTDGLVYIGPITGVGGTAYIINAPGAATTSLYGPDNLTNGDVAVVGVYKTGTNATNIVHGTIGQGSLSDLSTGGGIWTTVDYTNATHTYVHSMMGGYAVGNADTNLLEDPTNNEHAFIYNVATPGFEDVSFRFATNIISTTLYGIWYNGGTSYTLAGGYATLLGGPNAFLVNWDSSGSGTNAFSDWASYTNVTHFEGISSVTPGVYTLSGDGPSSLLTVSTNNNGTFDSGILQVLTGPGGTNISANSVYGTNVVGITTPGSAFQATVSPIPEPSAVALLTLSLGSLVLLRLRSRVHG
jgi:hypothetical protein